jgi:hypothetical protein
MTINIDPGVAQKLGEGVQTGNATELPYFCPAIWALNGNKQLLALGNAQYYGGWAIKAEDWEKACRDEWFTNPIPTFFAKTTMTTGDGKSLDVYTTRSLIVAPIATRTTWAQESGSRTMEYVEGSRQHVQAICMLANQTDQGYQMLGPVMLTAKGYQAKNLLDSFSGWNRATSKIRGQIAPGVPAWCFYLAVGTFGKDHKSLLVGKGQKQSTITPISAYIPKDISAELMEKLFVGSETAEIMVTYLEAAKEWLSAYSKTSPNDNGHASGAKSSTPSDPFESDDFMPLPDENIPF